MFTFAEGVFYKSRGSVTYKHGNRFWCHLWRGRRRGTILWRIHGCERTGPGRHQRSWEYYCVSSQFHHLNLHLQAGRKESPVHQRNFRVIAFPHHGERQTFTTCPTFLKDQTRSNIVQVPKKIIFLLQSWQTYSILKLWKFRMRLPQMFRSVGIRYCLSKQGYKDSKPLLAFYELLTWFHQLFIVWFFCQIEYCT